MLPLMIGMGAPVSAVVALRCSAPDCGGLVIALFNALPCCDSCGEMSERTFEGLSGSRAGACTEPRITWFCVPG
jgi:hypothetical protein